MAFISSLLLGIGLSMDSFALSLSCGVKTPNQKIFTSLKVAFIFSLVQASTPLIGWLLGKYFMNYIENFDHWVAFSLLGIIGGNMIREALTSEKKVEECNDKPLNIGILFLMGITTSIDALAVGVVFDIMQLNISLTIFAIWLCTFIISLIGFFIGDKLGQIFKKGAEIFGGIVLIGLGIKILIEHLKI